MKFKNWDIEKLKEIRSTGKTYKQIGELYGVTHQRISQIIGDGRFIKYKEGYRKCHGKCKKILPITFFYKNTRRCIECSKERAIFYANKNYKDYNKGGKYWKQALARSAVHIAIIKGKIKKGDCFMKDNECRGRIEGDHWHGYDKEHYLDVRWVCQGHHRKIDNYGWGNLNKT